MICKIICLELFYFTSTNYCICDGFFGSSSQPNLMHVSLLAFPNILPARRWMLSYGMKKLEGG